jgi:hypothetical protein
VPTTGAQSLSSLTDLPRWGGDPEKGSTMTEENFPGEEPVAAGDETSTRDRTPVAAALEPDPDSVEPKGYPDVAEMDSGARREESISGEEEDFLGG